MSQIYEMDPDGYPHRPERVYGRGVWPMGECGDAGFMVEGHDRRAWAALGGYARGIDLLWPLDLARELARDHKAVRIRWATFRTTCGCTAAQHVEHVANADPDGESASCYEDDDTGLSDCAVLPPCTTEQMAWIASWHSPDALPTEARPVLVVET